MVQLRLEEMSSVDIAWVLQQEGMLLSQYQVDNAWDNGRKNLIELVNSSAGCN